MEPFNSVFLGVGVVQRVKVELPGADTGGGVKHRGCVRRSTPYLVLAVEEHCQPLTYTVSRCGAISITLSHVEHTGEGVYFGFRSLNQDTRVCSVETKTKNTNGTRSELRARCTHFLSPDGPSRYIM